MSKQYYIGIDIGGTKIYGGLVTAIGEILVTSKVSTPAKAGIKEVVSVLEKVIKNLTTEAGIPIDAVLGIGIAVPGIVDNCGMVIATPNLELGQVNLVDICRKKFRKPIVVGNDVNLGVLGERWLGACQKAENIVGLFLGTGIGGGVIVNNFFMSGRQGAAAEIGHMIIDQEGPECSCGNRGCLEAYAGRWAIERDLRKAISAGERSIITEICGKRLEQVKSGALAKAIKAHDKVVMKIVDKAVLAVSNACVSLNHLLNPEVFLFGGGVIDACGEYYLPKIEKALNSDPFFKKLQAPKVVRAKLGDNAVMLGAVAVVLQVAGQRLARKEDYYPSVRYAPDGKVWVNGKSIEESFFVRADGKIKMLKEKVIFPIRCNEIESVIKKGANKLIIATSNVPMVSLDPKSLKVLKRKNIQLLIEPLSHGVKIYNETDFRKSLLVIM